MPKKEIIFRNTARQKLLKGIGILADAVSVTLGPKGRNVLIGNFSGGAPDITKDGVTVAKAVNLIDQMEDQGARLIRQAAMQTNENAGDGPQPLDALVYTPKGPVLMGGMQVGMRICGTSQSTQTVLGVFEKGSLPVYRITVRGGRTVRCSGYHLWTVATTRGKVKTLTTEELLKDYTGILKNGDTSYKYYLPRTCTNFAKQAVPIDPYLVGLLLGDGSLSGNTKKSRSSIELSLGKHKAHILHKLSLPKGTTCRIIWVEEKSYYRVKFKGTLRNLLKQIGLYGTKSKTKFIPELYLQNTVKCRKAVLQGLLDTDGHINKRGRFEYSTVSDGLKDNFLDLCWSLGIVTNYKYYTNREGGYSDTPVHRITQLKGFKHGLQIVDIHETGEVVPMRCIKVSNPDHLYITDNFIPTHNTTSSTVLAASMIKDALAYMEAHTDVNTMRMKEGMEEALTIAVGEIELQSKMVKLDSANLKAVARVSCNNDIVLGDLVIEAFRDVGRHGLVDVELSRVPETYKNTKIGYSFDRGYCHPVFVPQGENTINFKECLVVVTNEDIRTDQQVEVIWGTAEQLGKPLLLICNTLKLQAKQTIIHNKVRMGDHFSIVVIHAPAAGHYKDDLLQDIAIYTNSTFFDENAEMSVIDLEKEDFGIAREVKISKFGTVIYGETDVANVAARVDSIKQELVEVDTDISRFRDGDDEIQFRKKRIARLTTGISMILVGADTPAAAVEKEARAIDSIHAVRAALNEGIVPGGGVVFLQCIEAIKGVAEIQKDKDKKKGMEIVAKALSTPFEQILINAGLLSKFKTKMNELIKDGKGVNAATGEVCDMLSEGIIDPKLVSISALKNAVSISATIMTTEVMIVPVDSDSDTPYDSFTGFQAGRRTSV